MIHTLLIAVVSLGAIALLLALILYVVSKRFAVYEDPRVGQVAEVLPQANCGGCGFPGCSGFAAACVRADSLEGMRCPVGGQPVMDRVASILGLQAGQMEPMVAVVHCHGDCDHRPQLNIYDGTRRCAILSSLCEGESGCAYGCLGCGDCVDACTFGGLQMNPSTGLPEVNASICTACGACAQACPRGLIELRPRNKAVVQCANRDKGGVARKACSVACIGCSKCAKACPSGAIVLADNLACIDPQKCEACGECLKACPQGTIVMN